MIVIELPLAMAALGCGAATMVNLWRAESAKSDARAIRCWLASFCYAAATAGLCRLLLLITGGAG